MSASSYAGAADHGGRLNASAARRPSVTAMMRRGTVLVCALVLVFAAEPAHANIGIPMIMLMWPAAWLLLVAIVPIEALVARRVLGRGREWRVSAVANLVSTAVGIPIAWLTLVLIQMVVAPGNYGVSTAPAKLVSAVVQSAWLLPYDAHLHWMVPAAAATLCVPFYFASVLCEYLVARRFYAKEDYPKVRRWAWLANGL